MKLIVFVAIAASEIAAPHWNDVRQDDVIRGQQRFRYESGLPDLPLKKKYFFALRITAAVEFKKDMRPSLGAQANNLGCQSRRVSQSSSFEPADSMPSIPPSRSGF